MKVMLDIWQLLPFVRRKLMARHQLHPIFSTIVAVTGLIIRAPFTEDCPLLCLSSMQSDYMASFVKRTTYHARVVRQSIWFSILLPNCSLIIDRITLPVQHRWEVAAE